MPKKISLIKTQFNYTKKIKLRHFRNGKILRERERDGKKMWKVLFLKAFAINFMDEEIF